MAKGTRTARFLCEAVPWNPEKNEALKAERGISFERIVLAIEEGGILHVLRHPNERR